MSRTGFAKPARKPLFYLVWVAIVSLGGTAAQASGTGQVSHSGCTQNKNIYTCDWQTFRQAFTAAHSVGVPVAAMDRFTAVQLRQLVGELGKTVASRDQPADLIFSVVAVDPTGIELGPADQPLATLQVYATNGDSGRRTLLWVETYTGQPDRPWAADVKAVIDQFRERVSQGKH